MKDFSQFINEVLTKSDPIEKWIHDFVHSDNPKFAGKSKEERIKMAQGAYYGSQKEAVKQPNGTDKIAEATVDTADIEKNKNIKQSDKDKLGKLADLMKKQVKEESGEHHDVEHVMKTMKKVDYDTYTKHMRKNDADHSMENKHGVDTQHSGSFTGKIHGAEVGHKHSKSGQKEYYIKEEQLDEISKETLGDYVHKSFAAGNELHKQIETETDPAKKAVLKAKLSQRNTGVIKAAKKIREEETMLSFDDYLDEAKGVAAGEWHVHDTKTGEIHSTHSTHRKAINAMNKLNQQHDGYETPGGIIQNKYGAKAASVKEETLDEATIDHQHKIARDTVRNPNKSLLGGPTAAEAEKTLRTKYGYDDKKIAKLKEQAPVAGSLYRHTVVVHVSDPDAPEEGKQKKALSVLTTHPKSAEATARKHFEKKGWKVHSVKSNNPVHEAELHPNQKKLDLNKNGKLDADDFKKLRKEETLDEVTLQAHKVGVTVSDPNHTSVSQRKETVQKHVIVKATDKGEAQAKAEAFYKKKGYKVHDSFHHSVVPATSLKTEEVQLDEVTSPMQKLRDAHDRHMEKALAANKAGDDEAVKVHQVYMQKIRNKMDKLKRNEEIDLTEMENLCEISKATLGSYVKKAGDDYTKREVRIDRALSKDITTDTKAAEKKQANRKTGISKAVDKLTKEEVEELDELDKKTLSSYVKKSHDQLMKHTGTVNMKYGRGDKDATAYALDKDALRKTANRTKGIDQALNNLTKEDTMVTYKEFMASIEEGKIDDLKDKLAADREKRLSSYDYSKEKENKKSNSTIVKAKNKYGAGEEEGEDESGEKAKPAEPAQKRGRGRPAGSKSGVTKYN